MVMDEPTSSLTENEVNILFSIIRKLKADGVGIIYVSHRKLKIMENEKHPLDDLKNDKITKKREK